MGLVETFKEHDDKIVVLGMSCVGKTTFSKSLSKHTHKCFDARFPWHEIETLGMSISSALQNVARQCYENKFVLDGWHSTDLEGRYMPESKVYVIYSTYGHIVDQYRKKVNFYSEFFHMYKKWYSYRNPNARYFFNNGQFIETNFEEYLEIVQEEVFNFQK